ncbi:Trm112 family protein [Planktomarina temperata]|nr:Trm112 family protein [Planktomarina temperata]
MSGIDGKMLEALICPQTGGPLIYDASAQELISKSAHLAYPIREAIPIMLVSEAREIDEPNP